ncbi:MULTISPECIES: alkaline phosphatase family protein [Mycobacterium]|jgi:acid phosphatase|uniref:Acid phosphatase n=1 Tax=Mycobacterium gordonae TaxID=1778 RepID=A0A1A6BAU4_MYCGO|nr:MULTISPECIES: alkaline phosphatase family protein [Mycobacterium]MBI2700256.1 acid phosphatase [Mycobacterium sp.]MBX9981165.1 alkaline phosphatase family protein [Mycobacterium gordonae]MCQ4363546.1 alkaline phosphatase family protein [Mycobacterium gordonae]MCV7009883.1 acid phosphatase [Mycobacterium gordonae]OBR99442.1 acid phosphatase [Mycobacterium gordonae]
MRRLKRHLTSVFCALAGLSSALLPIPRLALAAATLPAYTHVVVVIEENRSQANIIGNKAAPFINALAAGGAMMAQSFAETHPSEPNYLALFAGSTFGLTKDSCPVDVGAQPNLASELLAAGRTFGGYAEDLPAVGSTACSAGKYARKHVPWVNFSNVPASVSVPFSAFPGPGNYASLPTVSFVIPNNDNNMHDGSIAQGDAWLNSRMAAYANWARANNSLLILTWDEDDGGPRNQIPTVFYGAHVQPGSYNETISHYNVLSTLQEMYGLPKTGYAATAPVIATIWGG